MGLWGVGRAFSDRSFLKILIFSTDFGRFRGGEVNLPPPPGIGLTPMLPRINPIPGGVFEGFFIFILAHEDMR